MLFLDTILEIAFPSKCLACGKSGADLCLKCLQGSPPAERESAEWIFPLYDYRHPAIKKSLWLLKYKGKRRLANVFAESLYEKILEELSELGPLQNFVDPLIIPIPLSRTRRRERGFNQVELLIAEILKINTTRHGIVLVAQNKVLIKPNETEHQARIRDRRERMKNISGSFAVHNENIVKDRNIILVDDILTTGATLTEARKVLRLAGAKKIIAFTIAH